MTVDRLTSLFDRFRVSAQMFHAGTLCGASHFSSDPGLGFVHVLRGGSMKVVHRKTAGGPPKRLHITEPSLLFYPRPLDHDFIYPPEDGSQLVCASLRFEGGAMHPLARALPPLVVVPLSEVPALASTLELLFAEADQARCGRPLLANRLFEVLLIQLLRWLLDRQGAEAVLPEGLLAGLADPQLARALVAMHEQPAHPWDLPALAERAGMSRSSFAASFKRVVGETPAEHLAQWRLALAQQRLARGEAIKRVALEVGYGSASALSRAFSARVGKSPRAWLDDRELA
jgi:AraC-like DNA-binding protein